MRCNTKQSIYYYASSLYVFRVSTTPIIRSTQNCNYSLRYWSYFLCSYLLPTWSLWWEIDMIWCDMIYDIIYDMIHYDTIRYDICYDMIQYDTIWYMLWYICDTIDMLWHDMVWYDTIRYDMTYLLTAILLRAVSSSTLHMYTQTVHRTTQLTTRTTQQQNNTINKQDNTINNKKHN
jgi:hypothetical protein